MIKLPVTFWILAASLLTFYSCEKADLNSPVLTLIGGDMEILLNDTNGFIEPGFFASDETDGNITSQVAVSGDVVDVSQIGTYQITYKVTDAAGNWTAKTRQVDVIVNQSHFISLWTASEVVTGSNPDTNLTYTAVISTAVDPTALTFENIADLGVFVTTMGSFDKFGNMSIPLQNYIGASSTGTISGSLTTEPDGLSLNVELEVISNSGTETDQHSGIWIKQ